MSQEGRLSQALRTRKARCIHSGAAAPQAGTAGMRRTGKGGLHTQVCREESGVGLKGRQAHGAMVTGQEAKQTREELTCFSRKCSLSGQLRDLTSSGNNLEFYHSKITVTTMSAIKRTEESGSQQGQPVMFRQMPAGVRTVVI